MSENFVLNELIKSLETPLYYWTSGNEAEVDFIAQINSNIVPIEVKSERNVKAKSLGIYLDEYKPSFAVRTSLKPDVGGDRLFRLPLYLISEIKNAIG